MKNILILGAGFVSPPIVSYLLSLSDCRVIVGSRHLERARKLLDDHPRGEVRPLEVDDEDTLRGLMREADVVVSLVPYAYHPQIAALAVEHGVHMVTTSYVSPEMQALDAEARRRGVMLLNEIGLDPGLDHMSAMRVFERVRSAGGVVERFSSCCGGLPAPESNTNPWRYKFSWSPRGALLASRQPARYRAGGEIVEVGGEVLLGRRWPYQVEGVGLFEIYPNRDSLAYQKLYKLDHARDMFRGTIRYPGFCETLEALATLGLMDDTPQSWEPGSTYAQLMARYASPGAAPLAERIAARLGIPGDHDIIARLEWAGLLSDRPLPGRSLSPLDILVERFQKMMAYRPGERDMILLRHEFVVRWADPRPRDRIVSRLVAYGDPGGYSAMARTVALPAAIATRLLLERKPDLAGVTIPIFPEIYGPVLDELEERGIRFVEAGERILPSPFEAPQGAGGLARG